MPTSAATASSEAPRNPWAVKRRSAARRIRSRCSRPSGVLVRGRVAAIGEQAYAPVAKLRPARSAYGVVVDSVNVSVLLYVPVRSASLAPMCCLKPTVTTSLDTGAVHAAFDNETSSGDGSENVPLVRCPGSEYVSAASPAVEMTLAVVEVV